MPYTQRPNQWGFLQNKQLWHLGECKPSSHLYHWSALWCAAICSSFQGLFLTSPFPYLHEIRIIIWVPSQRYNHNTFLFAEMILITYEALSDNQNKLKPSVCVSVFWTTIYICYLIIIIIFFFLPFLRPHWQHMEVPRLGVELELQLLAFDIAIAMHDSSLICDLHHSLQQCQILNPLSKAGDWPYIPKDGSWVCYYWATMGTPSYFFFWLPQDMWNS